MWSCAAAVVFVFSLGVTAQDEPQPSPVSLYSEPEPSHPSPASLYSEPEPLPSTSPLAQLLASATGSRSLLFPAISGQRNKRKPFQFKHKGRSKFRPKSFKKTTQETNGKQKNEIRAPTTLKPRFGFLDRPGPVTQRNIDNNNNIGKDQPITPGDQTTTQPLKLTDFFGTPEPEPAVAQARAATVGQVTTSSKLQSPIPFAISNDISANAFSDHGALFNRLQSITGAQPVGVTRDIAGVGEQGAISRKLGNRVPKQVGGETSGEPAVSGETTQVKLVGGETRGVQPGGNQVLISETGGNRMLVEKMRGDTDRVLNGESRLYQVRQQKQRRRGKVCRRRTVDRKHPKEEVENDGRQGKQLSFVKAPRSPRKKKSNFVRKKRNKASIVTVDRYRYKNEDGSITWGYKNDDGGFKEETIGVDCITHGKYGYTDSYGEKREYSYSSGVRCHPETRKVAVSDPNQTGTRGPNSIGFYDYSQNKFVMPDGRRVTIVVNEGNKARGRRY